MFAIESSHRPPIVLIWLKLHKNLKKSQKCHFCGGHLIEILVSCKIAPNSRPHPIVHCRNFFFIAMFDFFSCAPQFPHEINRRKRLVRRRHRRRKRGRRYKGHCHVCIFMLNSMNLFLIFLPFIFSPMGKIF
jgi:hypothetical protein